MCGSEGHEHIRYLNTIEGLFMVPGRYAQDEIVEGWSTKRASMVSRPGGTLVGRARPAGAPNALASQTAPSLSNAASAGSCMASHLHLYSYRNIKQIISVMDQDLP